MAYEDYNQADQAAIDEEEKRRRQNDPTVGEAVGDAAKKWANRFTDSNGDFSLGKTIASGLTGGGNQQTQMEKQLMTGISAPGMTATGQGIQSVSAPAIPQVNTGVESQQPAPPVLDSDGNVVAPQVNAPITIPQAPVVPATSQAQAMPVEDYQTQGRELPPQQVASVQPAQPGLLQRFNPLGTAQAGTLPPELQGVQQQAQTPQAQPPQQVALAQQTGAPIQTGAPQTAADVAGLVQGAPVATPPISTVDPFATAGYDERIMSVLSNPHATEDELGALRYDKNLPADVKESIRERMEPLLKAQLNIPPAMKTIEASMTDPKAARIVSKETSEDKPEGSWIKALLLAKLGMTDLAQEEFIKLGLGDSTSKMTIDGEPVTYTKDAKGRIKYAKYVGGDKAGEKLSGAAEARLMIEANDSRVKVDQKEYETRDDKGQVKLWNKVTYGGQTFWRDQSGGGLQSNAPAGVDVAFDKTIQKSAIESATKAVENMEKENAALEAKGLPARYSQAQITQAFNDRQALVRGGSIRGGQTGGATGGQGGTYRDVIGRSEGGAAEYDAIYGYGQKGGDPRIPAMTGGKNLSQLSIADALKIGDSRMGNNTGAIGKYQFLPSTLRSVMGSAGLTEADQFSPQNQEKLFDALQSVNAGQLKQSGIEPTEANLAVAHAVGAAGAVKLLDPANANKNAADVLGLSGAGKTTNPQLNKPVSEYLADSASRFGAAKPTQLASAVTSDANPVTVTTPAKPAQYEDVGGVKLDMSKALPQYSSLNPGLQAQIKQVAAGKETLDTIKDEQIRNIVQQNALALNPNLSSLTFAGAKKQQESDIELAQTQATQSSQTEQERQRTWEGPEPSTSAYPTTRNGFSQQAVKAGRGEEAFRTMNELIANHPKIAGIGRTQDLIDFGVKIMTGGYDKDEIGRQKYTDVLLQNVTDPRDRAAAERYIAVAQKAANTINKEVNPAGAFNDSDAVRAAKQSYGALYDQGAITILSGTRDYVAQNMRDKALAEFVRTNPQLKNVDQANTEFNKVWKPVEAQINGVNEVRLKKIDTDMATKYGDNWKDTYNNYVSTGQKDKAQGMFKQLTAFTADNERRYAIPKYSDGQLKFANKDQQFAAEYGKRQAGL